MNINIHKNCDPKLVNALRNFENKITPSHSTTSRRYSIWSLLRREVEPSLKEAFGSLKELKLFSWERLFAGGFNERNSQHLEDTFYQLRSQFTDNLCDKNEKLAYATCCTAYGLIIFCKNHLPKKVKMDVGGCGNRLNRGNSSSHFPYCELCGELCESAQNNQDSKYSGVEKDVADANGKAIRFSLRFCKKHKPGCAVKPGSDHYRRDHCHRFYFQQKVAELKTAFRDNLKTPELDMLKKRLVDEGFYQPRIIDKKKLKKQIYSFVKECESDPAKHYDLDQLIREEAYKLTHPPINDTRRKTSAYGKEYTLKRVRELQLKGCSISEAAIKIGVSRQAAWKALKKAGDI